MKWTFRTAFDCDYLWVSYFSFGLWCSVTSKQISNEPSFFYGIGIRLVIFFIAYNFGIKVFCKGVGLKKLILVVGYNLLEIVLIGW